MSDEATDFVESVFEDGGQADIDMADGSDVPESFDDLIQEGEDYDSNNQEVPEADGNSDSPLPSQESEDPVSEDSGENPEASGQASKEDQGEGDEAGQQGEESEQELDPVQSYLKEEEEVKVNGELQKYSREHLLAKGKEMIAGEIAYDRKFSELDVERKQYQKEVGEVEGYINKFGEIAQTGDILGALQYFSEFTSIPPYELRQQLINQLIPEVHRLEGLDPAEAQLEYTKQKNEYLEQKYETESQMLAHREAQREVEMQANGLQQSHNIAPAEWDSASQILQEHLDGKQEVTPELVANYVITDRAYTQAESLLDTVDVNLKADGGVLDEMQRIIVSNPEYTEKDLLDIVNEAFGEKQEQSEQEKQIVEKVKKNSPKQLKQKSDDLFKPITIDGEEVEDFDDLL